MIPSERNCDIIIHERQMLAMNMKLKIVIPTELKTSWKSETTKTTWKVVISTPTAPSLVTSCQVDSKNVTISNMYVKTGIQSMR